MRTQPIQIIVLEPEEGYVLTNGETYSRRVYLGTADSPDNWWEIPDADVPDPDAPPTDDEATGVEAE